MPYGVGNSMALGIGDPSSSVVYLDDCQFHEVRVVWLDNCQFHEVCVVQLENCQFHEVRIYAHVMSS
jgi:hypothetical protein